MKKKISYLLFIAATVIWGLAFVAQKNATTIPPFAVGALRSGLAVIFLILVIPITDRIYKNGRHLLTRKRIPDITKKELIGGAVLGVILTVASAFQQYGLADTDAGKAAFITALYVVIVPIISSLLGKRPSVLAVISIPIAIVGFYLLCVQDGVTFVTSDLLILVCAVIFASHIISVDRLSPGCDGVRMSLVQFTVSFLLNGIISLLIEQTTPEAIWVVMPSLLFLGIGSSGIAYTLQILGQKEADPTISSVILSLESVFGVIGGALLLGESLSGKEYLGCAIVFLAVILAQLEPQAIKKLIKSIRG